MERTRWYKYSRAAGSSSFRSDEDWAAVNYPSPDRGGNMALSLFQRVQLWLLKAVTGVLAMFFQLFLSTKPGLSGKKLPPISNPLLLQSATQLAKKIRRKEVGTWTNANLLTALAYLAYPVE